MEQQYGKNRLQIRCEYESHRIHIQGVGKQMNRKYGIALQLRAPLDVTEWLREQEPTNVSPASGEMLYIPASFMESVDGVSQLLLHGERLNHPDGAMLDLKQPNKSEEVKVLREFAFESGLLTVIVEPYKSENEEE